MQIKAQMSVEYMILTGFLLLTVIVSGVAMIYFYGNDTIYSSLNQQKIADLGNGLSDSAKQLYFLGLYSKKTTMYDLPDTVSYIFILQINESSAPPLYYIGVFLKDTKTKQFFPVDAPIFVNASSIDSTQEAAIRTYMPECSPPSTATCIIHPFKTEITSKGKKNFKLETMYESTDTTIGVQITPLFS